jgi:predicted AlkP superfamily phosphohydrolase/phosphomutase
LNGLYINLKDREEKGIVPTGKSYDELIESLCRDLLALRDPANGQAPITSVLVSQRDYHGPYAEEGPDLVIGYGRGYRSSWESPLGDFPKEIFVDNKQAWSADHCVDPSWVPGVLLSNRKIVLERPSLTDLTVTVLHEFGLEPLPEMIGKNCLADPSGLVQTIPVIDLQIKGDS